MTSLHDLSALEQADAGAAADEATLRRVSVQLEQAQPEGPPPGDVVNQPRAGRGRA